MSHVIMYRWVKRLSLALACCIIIYSGAGFARPSSPMVVSTTFPGDLFLYDQQQIEAFVSNLKISRVNTVAVPIAWRGVETKSGQFDFSRYVAGLDRLVAEGFDLLLILDSSARIVLNASLEITQQPAVPDWLVLDYETSFATDASDVRGFNLDYHDRKHIAVLKRFYGKSLAFFIARYGEKIVAVAPGVTHELEIKYPQYFYRWQSYTKKAQSAFASWLLDRGKQPAALPRMQYGNNLSNHLPTAEPLFAELMRFREAALSRYVCRLTRWIRSHGVAAAGYFGQALSSHDGIYAAGVIEQLVDCFDKIVIDYNFFDGWDVERQPELPSMLVSYALNLGYESVMAGLYFERFPTTENYMPLLRETLASLADLPIAGLELGNMHVDKLRALAEPLGDFRNRQRAEKNNHETDAKIGLVASKWTFYLWIGEHSNERKIIQDTLLASYSLLRKTPGFSVSVLGERALIEQDLSRYDALIIPHQTTVSATALAAIKQYHENGGRLVQDLRFDAFSGAGKPNGQWQHELFGIGAIGWCKNEHRFRYKGRPVWLPPQENIYFDCAMLLPGAESAVLMPSVSQPATGLILRGTRTLTFGFIPHLIEDEKQPAFWSWLYLDAINDLLNNKAP